MKLLFNRSLFIVFLISIAYTCTDGDVPELTTFYFNIITDSTAFCECKLINDGGNNITSSGVCWSSKKTPTVNDLKTNDTINFKNYFSSKITGLKPNTTYYVRAYASNKNGTGYGNIIELKTMEHLNIKGTIYHVIEINGQQWMVENLKVTKYRNGELIDKIENNGLWSQTTKGSFSAYNNDENNASIYGYLYNWYAINNPGNICPEGWRLPSDSDFIRLCNNINYYVLSGRELKETGFAHWNSPNEGATNALGFTALPGGIRSSTGYFDLLHCYGFWWTSTTYSENDGSCVQLSYIDNYLEFFHNRKSAGLSVRCIRETK